MNANHFQLLDGKSRLFCGPAKNLPGLAVEKHWFSPLDPTIVFVHLLVERQVKWTIKCLQFFSGDLGSFLYAFSCSNFVLVVMGQSDHNMAGLKNNENSSGSTLKN